MAKTALILGASGKTGRHAARALEARGWTIRRFNRAKDDMVQAAQGCDLIVNGMNPRNYHDWAGLIPAITVQVIAAARASGATVLIPGNVYHFGNQPGEWSENTAPRPCARKGQIRLDMERTYRESGIRTIILRAGDFIDPDRDGDTMSRVLLSGIKRGKLTAPGPTDIDHAYTYLPDWAEAAARLAELRDDLAQFEDIPFGDHHFTLERLRSALETELRRPIRFSLFPWWAIRLAGPFWELARELNEMRYLWQVPHRLSTIRLKALLPDFEPTPIAEVIRAALPPDIHPNKAMAAGRPGNLAA